ncbi:MAG: PadR family transcriptional regulator [Hyphomicrobiales bacterium]|nr:PadR family transcriptional regulator [Hyphomicrobiales bacterium]
MDAKTLCLGVLALGDASGYEIKKQFEDGPFGQFHQVGFGSIYPALTALAAEGQVTFVEEAQEGRPDKKVYSITPAGLAALKRALRKPPAADRVRSEYLFILFFAEMLEPERRREVYESYLDTYRSRLAEMEEAADCHGEVQPGHRFVFHLGKAFYTTMVDFMENNRHLLFPEDTGRTDDRAAPLRRVAGGE